MQLGGERISLKFGAPEGKQSINIVASSRAAGGQIDLAVEQQLSAYICGHKQEAKGAP